MLENSSVKKGVFAGLLALLATIVAACSAGAAPATATPGLEPTTTVAATPTYSPAVTATKALSLIPATPDSPTSAPSSAATPPIASAPSTAGTLAEQAFSYVAALSETLGPRESATDQERAAAEYLASEFEGLGYSVKLQPFEVRRLSRDKSSLVLQPPGPEKAPERVEVVPLAGSAAADASGVLVPVGLARSQDLPQSGLEGKIALAKRGTITFGEKANRVGEAGAAGIVIYNNRPGNFRGVLPSQGAIPAVAVSQEEGERIEGLASAGDVLASISVQTELLASRNVVAEDLRPPRRSERVVVLGAHFDTVPGVPGANDNASGAAVVLTIAKELARAPVPFSVRFVAFGSEELGLLGSKHYVDSLSSAEQGRVEAMLNFDALATGERLGILGSSELTGPALEEAAARGIDVRASAGLQGGDSDHTRFAEARVPVLMFFAEDFSRIHTPEDTLSFVNSRLLGDAAILALAVLRSPGFLPE
jgi:aminopeptidase YwaD